VYIYDSTISSPVWIYLLTSTLLTNLALSKSSLLGNSNFILSVNLKLGAHVNKCKNDKIKKPWGLSLICLHNSSRNLAGFTFKNIQIMITTHHLHCWHSVPPSAISTYSKYFSSYWLSLAYSSPKTILCLISSYCFCSGHSYYCDLLADPRTC
jgi:hypothetical protein